MNRRTRTIAVSTVLLGVLCFIWLGGLAIPEGAYASALENRNLGPSLAHPFGTDWLGRDMLMRTWKGLSVSIGVGLTAAAASVIIAAALGLAAATLGAWADRIVTWLIDLFLSVPHLVTLILIAFISGGGLKGIMIGIAVTHWPSLSRVIRAELLQLRSSEYVELSRKLGRSRWWVATRHMLPHVAPQCLVGLLLLFPHAILHESAITFIGLGLSPHQPAIGIILSESMRYLSVGMWWLAFFPGLCLLLVVRSFGSIAEQVSLLTNPRERHNG